MPVTLVKKVGANDIKFAPTWRKRWDSNPRAREDYLISSQARYDHFDTLPYCVYSIIMENFCAFILAKI